MNEGATCYLNSVLQSLAGLDGPRASFKPAAAGDHTTAGLQERTPTHDVRMIPKSGDEEMSKYEMLEDSFAAISKLIFASKYM